MRHLRAIEYWVRGLVPPIHINTDTWSHLKVKGEYDWYYYRSSCGKYVIAYSCQEDQVLIGRYQKFGATISDPLYFRNLSELIRRYTRDLEISAFNHKKKC